jgi:hypothetical protein
LDRQLEFSASPRLTPKVHLGPDAFCPFAHAAQSPMSRAAAFLQYLRVNALPIIPNAKTEDLISVSDLGFNSMSIRVPEGISQYLQSDPADFTPAVGRQHSSIPFLDQLELRGIIACAIQMCKFTTRRREKTRKISILDQFRT